MADSANQEVVRSPYPVSNSVVQLGGTHFLKDSTEEAITNDKDKTVKDRRGRNRIVYDADDDDNITEYESCMPHVKMDANDNSNYPVDKFLEGIDIQQRKRYPFSVIIDDQQKSITPSKSNRYREGREFEEVKTLNKDTLLFKHLKENPHVRLVRDMVTGFTHICKTRIMLDFKCEEVQAMRSLPNVAPKLYVINRDGEDVILHMELIEGKRLDTVSSRLMIEHMWPLCLHIFSEILQAIRILMFKKLSHNDIHTKNIIIEVVEEGKIRIRLLDYGDAREYTINSLRNDMESLVATLLTLFTMDVFDCYKDKPDEWIRDNPAVGVRFPNQWHIFKCALNVTNRESLGQFIYLVEGLLADDSENPDFQKILEQITELLKK